MKAKTVIFALILLGLVAVMVYIYLTKEQPIQSNAVKTVNISIDAHEKNTPDTNVIVGYVITGNGINITGQTLKQGSLLVSLPFGYIYNICTFNLPNESSYYSLCQQIDATVLINRHVSLVVNKPGIISVYGNGNLNDNNSNVTLYIQLSGNSIYNKPFVCINESFDLLYVNLNLSQINNPNGFDNYLQCYSIADNITKNSGIVTVPIQYYAWNKLNIYDSINVTVDDMDYINDNWVAVYNGTDVGGPPENYVFKYNNNIY